MIFISFEKNQRVPFRFRTEQSWKLVTYYKFDFSINDTSWRWRLEPRSWNTWAAYGEGQSQKNRTNLANLSTWKILLDFFVAKFIFFWYYWFFNHKNKNCCVSFSFYQKMVSKLSVTITFILNIPPCFGPKSEILNTTR